MKINFKRLAITILIPLALGAIVGFITNSGGYNDMVKPSFAPPGWLFPIVWTILYILMGVSYYKLDNISTSYTKKIYYAQLIVNLLWCFIFFTFKKYLLAFIWLLLLIVLVILMIKDFYKYNKTSAYLQIPYLIWIIFAAILNYAVYTLN